MHGPYLAATLANTVTRDRIAAAAGRAAAKEAQRGASRGSPVLGELVIRRAQAGDADDLEQLGVLDGDRRAGALLARLAGTRDVLVAEVGGEIEAAVALRETVAVADPFRPTEALKELLAMRASQISAEVAPASGARGGIVLRPHLH